MAGILPNWTVLNRQTWHKPRFDYCRDDDEKERPNKKSLLDFLKKCVCKKKDLESAQSGAYFFLLNRHIWLYSPSRDIFVVAVAHQGAGSIFRVLHTSMSECYWCALTARSRPNTRIPEVSDTSVSGAGDSTRWVPATLVRRPSRPVVLKPAKTSHIP